MITTSARRVLLASADDALRALVVEVLHEQEHLVEEATSEEALMNRALRARRDRDLSAIVVDLAISRAGLALLQALRALVPEPPFFVVCPWPAPDERARIAAMGAMVIDAPVDVNQLVEQLVPRRTSA